MKIRNGGPDDAADLLALLDGAVAWLAAQGRTRQWGDQPWSSRPKAVEKVHDYLGEAFLVRLAVDGDGRTVGSCVLAEEPPAYVAPAGERELYVRNLVTDRSRSGSGIGAALVADALDEARRRGIGLVRVDCYAGGDRRLVGRYRALGFTETEYFEAEQPDGVWEGQILAIRL
ncbi:GNAT family N-acetyltransferase [Kitasatospora sp. NPDC052868]|uniref:GNAT family N-acetyltransferase n=1 Tax=Kitasatospora sp. NPDC052868 TaxID=3364060 RepID=UPI0037C87FAA